MVEQRVIRLQEVELITVGDNVERFESLVAETGYFFKYFIVTALGIQLFRVSLDLSKEEIVQATY